MSTRQSQLGAHRRGALGCDGLKPIAWGTSLEPDTAPIGRACCRPQGVGIRRSTSNCETCLLAHAIVSTAVLGMKASAVGGEGSGGAVAV